MFGAKCDCCIGSDVPLLKVGPEYA